VTTLSGRVRRAEMQLLFLPAVCAGLGLLLLVTVRHGIALWGWLELTWSKRVLKNGTFSRRSSSSSSKFFSTAAVIGMISWKKVNTSGGLPPAAWTMNLLLFQSQVPSADTLVPACCCWNWAASAV